MQQLTVRNCLLAGIVLIGIICYLPSSLIGLTMGMILFTMSFGWAGIVILLGILLLVIGDLGINTLLFDLQVLGLQQGFTKLFLAGKFSAALDLLVYDALAVKINVVLSCAFAISWLLVLNMPNTPISIARIGKKTAKAKPTKATTQEPVLAGVELGYNRSSNKPVILTDKDANLHSMFVGTTGSGKTTALARVIKSAIDRKKFLVMVDGKGDTQFAERIRAYAKKKNRKFYLFSMLGESCKYNPLSSGGYTAQKDRLIELREWTEEHYKKLAEGYLQLVFKILKKANVSVDLFSLGKYMGSAALYNLVRELKDKELISAIKEQEEAEKNISSLKAEIQNFVSSEIGELFNTSEGEVLTLSQAYNEQAIVYFALQPLAFPSYAKTLGKLIINDLKALAVEQLQRKEQQPIFTLFDEFSVFAGQQIINLINQGRSAGVHAILSMQSLSDLAINEGEYFIGQVLNNCNNYVIFRQNDPEDAERLAGVIGTKNSQDYTAQVGEDGATGKGTIKRTKEYIIHPDEIKRLRLGEAVFVNKRLFKAQIIKIKQGEM